MSVSRKILCIFLVLLCFTGYSFAPIDIAWEVPATSDVDCDGNVSPSIGPTKIELIDFEGSPCVPCAFTSTVTGACVGQTGNDMCGAGPAVITGLITADDLNGATSVDISLAVSVTSANLEEDLCSTGDQGIMEISIIESDGSLAASPLLSIGGFGNNATENARQTFPIGCGEGLSIVILTKSNSVSDTEGYIFEALVEPIGAGTGPAVPSSPSFDFPTIGCPGAQTILEITNCPSCEITATPRGGGTTFTGTGSVTIDIDSGVTTDDVLYDINYGIGSTCQINIEDVTVPVFQTSLFDNLALFPDFLCPNSPVDLGAIQIDLPDGTPITGTWTGREVTNEIFTAGNGSYAVQFASSSADCGGISFNQQINVDETQVVGGCAATVAADLPTGPIIGAPIQDFYCTGQSVTLNTTTFDASCPTCLYEWVRQDVVVFSNTGDPATVVDLIADPSGTNTFILEFTDDAVPPVKTVIDPPLVVPLFQLSGNLDTLICFGESLDLNEFLPPGVTGTWRGSTQINGNDFNALGLASPNQYDLVFFPSFCPTTSYDKRVTILAGTTVTLPNDFTTVCQGAGTTIDLTQGAYNIPNGQWDLDGQIPPQIIDFNTLNVGPHTLQFIANPGSCVSGAIDEFEIIGGGASAFVIMGDTLNRNNATYCINEDVNLNVTGLELCSGCTFYWENKGSEDWRPSTKMDTIISIVDSDLLSENTYAFTYTNPCAGGPSTDTLRWELKPLKFELQQFFLDKPVTYCAFYANAASSEQVFEILNQIDGIQGTFSDPSGNNLVTPEGLFNLTNIPVGGSHTFQFTALSCPSNPIPFDVRVFPNNVQTVGNSWPNLCMDNAIQDLGVAPFRRQEGVIVDYSGDNIILGTQLLDLNVIPGTYSVEFRSRQVRGEATCKIGELDYIILDQLGTFTSNTVLCEQGAAINLKTLNNGYLPATGGEFINRDDPTDLTGFSGTESEMFDPSTLPPAVYNLQYLPPADYDDCRLGDFTFSITVEPLIVNPSQPASQNFCVQDGSSISLSQLFTDIGITNNGIYSLDGPGTSIPVLTDFIPSNLDVGSYTSVYTPSDLNNDCQNFELTFDITPAEVNSVSVVDTTICQRENLDLRKLVRDGTSTLPVSFVADGGTIGLDMGFIFNPEFFPGQTIDFTYSEPADGCRAAANIMFQVFVEPAVLDEVWDASQILCADYGPLDLDSLFFTDSGRPVAEGQYFLGAPTDPLINSELLSSKQFIPRDFQSNSYEITFQPMDGNVENSCVTLSAKFDLERTQVFAGNALSGEVCATGTVDLTQFITAASSVGTFESVIAGEVPIMTDVFADFTGLPSQNYNFYHILQGVNPCPGIPDTTEFVVSVSQIDTLPDMNVSVCEGALTLDLVSDGSLCAGPDCNAITGVPDLSAIDVSGLTQDDDFLLRLEYTPTTGNTAGCTDSLFVMVDIVAAGGAGLVIRSIERCPSELYDLSTHNLLKPNLEWYTTYVEGDTISSLPIPNPSMADLSGLTSIIAVEPSASGDCAQQAEVTINTLTPAPLVILNDIVLNDGIPYDLTTHDPTPGLEWYETFIAEDDPGNIAIPTPAMADLSLLTEVIAFRPKDIGVCPDFVTVQIVTVNNLDIEEPVIICRGEATDLTSLAGSSGVTWYSIWIDEGNAANLVIDDPSNVVLEGPVIAELLSASGTLDTQEISIVINPAPILSFAIDGDPVCDPAADEYGFIFTVDPVDAIPLDIGPITNLIPVSSGGIATYTVSGLNTADGPFDIVFSDVASGCTDTLTIVPPPDCSVGGCVLPDAPVFDLVGSTTCSEADFPIDITITNPDPNFNYLWEDNMGNLVFTGMTFTQNTLGQFSIRVVQVADPSCSSGILSTTGITSFGQLPIPPQDFSAGCVQDTFVYNIDTQGTVSVDFGNADGTFEITPPGSSNYEIRFATNIQDSVIVSILGDPSCDPTMFTIKAPTPCMISTVCPPFPGPGNPNIDANPGPPFCDASVRPVLRVSNNSDAANFQVVWYSGAAGVDSVGAGNEYTLPDEGVYSARFVNIVDSACNSSRVSTFTYEISGMSDATFMIPDFCAGIPQPAIIAGEMGGKFSFVDSPADGASIDEDTGVITTPSESASYEVRYTVNPTTCPGSMDQTVRVISKPFISRVDKRTNVSDNSIYDVIFDTNGDEIVITDVATGLPVGDLVPCTTQSPTCDSDSYFVDNIPITIQIQIESKFSGTNCSEVTSLTPPNLSCSGFGLFALEMDSLLYPICAGEPLPTLKVSDFDSTAIIDANELLKISLIDTMKVQWYDQEFGGDSLHVGFTYTPTRADTFWVVTHILDIGVDTSTCEFEPRTRVIVQELEPPSADVIYPDYCEGQTPDLPIPSTPNGVFSIVDPMTTARIDSETGELSNLVPGEFYTIRYEVGSRCPSFSEVVISAVPALVPPTDISTECDETNEFYRVGFTSLSTPSNPTAGDLVPGPGPEYTIENIPKEEPIFIDLESSILCGIQTFELSSGIDCSADCLAPEFEDGLAEDTYCRGMEPTLRVKDPGLAVDQVIEWYISDPDVPENLVATGLEFTPTEQGEYFVLLTDNLPGGCRSAAISKVLVANAAPDPSFTYEAVNCAGDSFLPLTVASPSLGAWTAVDASGTTVPTFNNSTGEFVNMPAGIYTVKFKTSFNSCRDSLEQTITVEDVPAALMDSDTTLLFDSATSLYSIVFSSMNIAAATTGNLDESGGQYSLSNLAPGETVSITLSNAAGCASDPFTFTLPVLGDCFVLPDPPIMPQAEYQSCPEAPEPIITPVIPAGTTLQWYADRERMMPINNLSDFIPSDEGTYYAEVIDAEGCTSEIDSFVYSFFPTPIISLADTSSLFDPATMTYTFSLEIGGGENIEIEPTGLFDVMSDSMDPQLITLSNIAAGTSFEIMLLSDEGCQSESLAVTLGTSSLCAGVIVDEPTIDQDTIQNYCTLDTLPRFTVNNVPLGGSINWYENETDITAIESTIDFQPPADGIYFAEAVDENGCVSSSRLEVQAIEILSPEIQDTASILEADGSFTFTIDVAANISSPVGTVTGVLPSWSITNIPAGTSMFTITIDDGNACPFDLDVNLGTAPPDCPAPPTAPTILTDLNVPICEGDMFTILAESDIGTSISWFDDPNTMTAIATGPELIVSTGGTYYYEALLDADCRSDRLSIDVLFSAPPQILNNRIDPVCDIAVGGYGFSIDAPDAVSITTEGFGVVTGDGASGWRISGLPAGLSFLLVAENSESCTTARGVQTDDMSCVACPPTVDPPALVDPTDTLIVRCTNGPYPAIETTVPSGFTVEWFKNGRLIGMGTSFIIPESESFGGEIKGVSTDGASCISTDSLTVDIMLIQGENASVGYAASNCEGDDIIPVILGTPGGQFSFFEQPLGAEINPVTGEITTQVDGSYKVIYMTPGVTCPAIDTFNFDIYKDIETTFFNVVDFNNTAMTYAVEFGLIPGGSISDSKGYVVDPVLNDTFRIRNIPLAESFDLEIELAGVFSCFDTIPVMNTIACGIIPEPQVSEAFILFCPSDSVPRLEATVLTDQRVVWYNAESGGTVLGEGIFTPDRPDGNKNFYAEAVDIFGCVSTGRQIVTLSPLMPLTAGEDVSLTDQICFRDTVILSDAIPLTTGTYDLEGFRGVIRSDTLFTNNLTPNMDYRVSYIVVDPDCGQDTAYIDFSLADCRPSASVSTVTVSTSCFDTADGSFSITVTQEQLDTYTFQWSQLRRPGRAEDLIVDPLTLSSEVTGLASGMYLLRTLDQGRTATSDTITIGSPGELGVTVREQSKIVCSGNANAVIEVNATGGTGPYSFEWNTGDTQDELSNIDEGNYTVTVTDANGCINDSGMLDVIDTDTIQFSVTFMEPLCPSFPDGEIMITDLVGGEGPFEFFLNGQSGLDETFNFLDVGTYGLSVQDSRGCVVELVDSIRIESYIDGKSIELPTELFADPGETVQMPLVLNNITLVQIAWAGPGLDCTDCVNPSFTMGDETRFYAVQVVDESGCVYEQQIIVSVTPDPPIYIPSAISQDPANVNNKFFFPYVEDDVTGSADIDVYDRWGNLVFTGTALDLRDPNLGWDGTLDKRNVDEQVYVYRMRIIIDGRNSIFERSGSVVVLR